MPPLDPLRPGPLIPPAPPPFVGPPKALTHAAPLGCEGSYAEGFGPIARAFASRFGKGHADPEVGGALAVHHRGRCVVDLWGGYADAERRVLWGRDTRIVVFSVTKGLMAMALNLHADRGQLQ